MDEIGTWVHALDMMVDGNEVIEVIKTYSFRINALNS